MTVKTGAEPDRDRQSKQEPRRPATHLDGRYGDIGIPALAAALRYSSQGKSPADEPEVQTTDRRFADARAW
jgi:hypothetical protein